jgi:hypothetical protein
MTQNEIFRKHLKQAARFEIKVLKFTLSVNADPARKDNITPPNSTPASDMSMKINCKQTTSNRAAVVTAQMMNFCRREISS